MCIISILSMLLFTGCNRLSVAEEIRLEQERIDTLCKEEKKDTDSFKIGVCVIGSGMIIGLIYLGHRVHLLNKRMHWLYQNSRGIVLR